jgi:hypothetical protein
MRLKELTYKARYFFGYLMKFTARLFYILIQGYSLLYCSYCGKGGGEWINLIYLPNGIHNPQH